MFVQDIVSSHGKVVNPCKCVDSMSTKVTILNRIALNFSLNSFSIIVRHVQKLTLWEKNLTTGAGVNTGYILNIDIPIFGAII